MMNIVGIMFISYLKSRSDQLAVSSNSRPYQIRLLLVQVKIDPECLSVAFFPLTGRFRETTKSAGAISRIGILAITEPFA
jgi:hypothetical protein